MFIQASPQARRYVKETTRYFSKVYGWMFIGLFVSGVTAFWTASTPTIISFFVSNRIIFYGLLIFEFILIWRLILMMRDFSWRQAIFLFLFYCFTSGLTLSVIFLAYSIETIATAFFISAGMFGIMSAWGLITQRDLTSMGRLLTMTVFGLVLTSVKHIFIPNEGEEMVAAVIGVITFSGLAAYHSQQLKKLNKYGNEGTEEDFKETIHGALVLYLNFVNLFLKMLRLLRGKRSRK